MVYEEYKSFRNKKKSENITNFGFTAQFYELAKKRANSKLQNFGLNETYV